MRVPEFPTGIEEKEMSGENRPKFQEPTWGGGGSDHVTKAYMMSPKASEKPVGLKGSEKVLGPNSEHKYFRRF